MAELTGVLKRRDFGIPQHAHTDHTRDRHPAVAHLAVGRLITTANTLEEVASHVAGALSEIVDARTVIVLLIDGSDLLMSSASSKGQVLRSGRLPGAAAAYEAWLRLGAPVQTDDIKDTLFEAVRQDMMALLGVSRLENGMAWPLMADDQPLGSILLVPRQRIVPGSDAWDTLSDAARLAALSVSNAYHHQQAVLAAARRSAAEERERLARDLHDSVTQSLYSLVLQAEGWRRQIEAGRLQPTVEQIAELGELGRLALREARLAIFDLYEDEQMEVGLLAGLLHRLHMVENRAGVSSRVMVTHAGRTDELIWDGPGGKQAGGSIAAPEIEAELRPVLYEALNNALRHAAATSVVVEFIRGEADLSFRVTDNGRGFDTDSIDAQRGFGLRSMQERIARLGGTLSLQSAPGNGTIIDVANIPLGTGTTP